MPSSKSAESIKLLSRRVLCSPGVLSRGPTPYPP